MPAYRKALLPVLVAGCNFQHVQAVDIWTVLTETVFNQIAPNAVAPYTYSGFQTAVNNWNSNNAGYEVFQGSTEMAQRHELAAFFGNTLHESDDFKASRELSMCQTQTIGSDGKLYCKPSGYASGDYNDPYCSAAHTPASDPDGCTCGPIAESTVAPGYLDAEKLFFGRGAIQLSWNYNYIDAGAALDADFCANPELVATDGEYAWGTALWFWATNTGSAGTCRTAVLTNGDFGSTLNIINSMECPVDSGHGSSVAQRLNYYCKAATTLGVDALLALDGCPLMASTFNTCAVAGGDCANCAAWNVAATTTTAASTTTQVTTTTPASTTTQVTTSTTLATTSSAVSTTSPATTTTAASATTQVITTIAAITTTSKTTDAAAPTNLYFPNWGAGYEGPHICLRDDGSNTVPAYAPLIPDLKECCDTHYGWNHAECMGVVSGPSNKFFPNWGAQPNICLFDDGSNTVPVGAPLISDLKECCDTHYGWNHDECMGVVQGPSNKYFPNWGGSPNICLFDDGSNTVPAGVPLFDDLKACCDAHYGWNHDQCMGVVQGPSNKYFPNWSSSVGPHICLFDDGSNAGPNGAPLFDSLSLCCTTHYSWNKNECLGIVTTPAPPSMNFFPDWAGANLGCIQDDGSNAVPDYMKGATSPYMYPTNDACCDARYSWRADECKLT